jgi:hypothetical protein
MNQEQTTYRYISNYQEVFSCLFMHDYYGNRVCGEVSIRPTSATSALIQDLQLIFKPTSGGFALAANTAKDYSHSVFQDSFDLNFEFRFTNPFFNSFSDLNVDPETRYFVDDNLQSEILLDDELQNKSPELDRPGISGVMRIQHQNSHPILPRVPVEASIFTPRIKIIYIKSREVKIVYICYTSENNLAHLEGLTIEIEGAFKGLATFTPPQRIQTNSGLPAVKFMTEKTLAMKASWRGIFRLERADQLGNYRKTLPNPSPQSLKYDFTTNTFISENYVKL